MYRKNEEIWAWSRVRWTSLRMQGATREWSSEDDVKRERREDLEQKRKMMSRTSSDCCRKSIWWVRCVPLDIYWLT